MVGEDALERIRGRLLRMRGGWNPERAAQIVREQLGQWDVRHGHLVNLSSHISVFTLPLGPATSPEQLPEDVRDAIAWLKANSDVDAVTLSRDPEEFVVLLRTEKHGRRIPRTRLLFTLAHEVGHIIAGVALGRSGTATAQCGLVEARMDPDGAVGTQGRTTYESFLYRKGEDDCDQFAAELLMPKTKLGTILETDGLREARRAFRKVSLDAFVNAVLHLAALPLLAFGWHYDWRGQTEGTGTVYFPVDRALSAPLQELAQYCLATGLVTPPEGIPSCGKPAMEESEIRSVIADCVKDGLPHSTTLVSSHGVEVRFTCLAVDPTAAKTEIIALAYLPDDRQLPRWLWRVRT